MSTEKGWVNIHIDVYTKKLFICGHPYKSKEEAEKGIFIGGSIEKVGCFEIEYTKLPDPNETFKNSPINEN
jgi:hypothetical protein